MKQRRLRRELETAPDGKPSVWRTLPAVPKCKLRDLWKILKRRSDDRPQRFSAQQTPKSEPGPSADAERIGLQLMARLHAHEMRNTEEELAARVQRKAECGHSLLAAAEAVALEVLAEWAADDGEWEGERGKRRKVRTVWRPKVDELKDALYGAARLYYPNALADARELQDFLREEGARATAGSAAA